MLALSTLDLSSVNDKYGLARFPSLQFAPDVEVDYDFSGPSAGTGFTQIAMTGPIALGSAALSLSFSGYTPAAGQSLTLVSGATKLSGTFVNAADGNDLPEGALFTTGGLQFKITYKGGAGRDVVITRQGGTTPTPTPTVPPQPNNKRVLPGLARDNRSSPAARAPYGAPCSIRSE